MSELRVLERLEDELSEAIERDRARPARRGRRWAMLGVLPGIGIAAAVAAAASGLLTGEPVRNAPGMTFSPTKGLGAVVPGSVRLTSLRVPDPDGGPPWGLRTLKTTRELACVQVRRVVDERLGLLGQDGAFGDDGRFHPLPASVLGQCALLDARGSAFLAVSYGGIAASGMQPQFAGRAQTFGCRVGQGLAPPAAKCLDAQVRVLQFGLLGPEATQVTARDALRRPVVRATDRQLGAYLNVRGLRAGDRMQGAYGFGVTPSSALISIAYADGHVCRIGRGDRLNGGRHCPPVGYVAPPRTVTLAKVISPVRVRFRSARLRAAPGSPATPAWIIDVYFRARVAGDGRSNYGLRSEPRTAGSTCRASLAIGSIGHDVSAGDIVHQILPVQPGCRVPTRVSVFYHQPGPVPESADLANLPGAAGDLRVGAARARP